MSTIITNNTVVWFYRTFFSFSLVLIQHMDYTPTKIHEQSKLQKIGAPSH